MGVFETQLGGGVNANWVGVFGPNRSEGKEGDSPAEAREIQ